MLLASDDVLVLFPGLSILTMMQEQVKMSTNRDTATAMVWYSEATYGGYRYRRSPKGMFEQYA